MVTREDMIKKLMTKGYELKGLQAMTDEELKDHLLNLVMSEDREREYEAGQQKQEQVDAFCEEMRQLGKPSAHDVETLRRQLMRADNRAPVVRFSDGGKTYQLTEMEAQMREVRSEPSGPAHPSNEGREVARLEKYCEANSADFRIMKTTKQELIDAYCSRRKASPSLTAEQFLGVKA